MEEKTEIFESKESDPLPHSSGDKGFEEFKSISLFENFNDSEKEGLFKIGTFQDFKPHSNIVIEGEKTRGIYIIISASRRKKRVDIIRRP